MFKSIKENVYVQKFLELWDVPRYRALIKLGLYIIFFIFVITLIKTQDNNISKNPVTKINVMENFKNMNNYQYKVIINNEVEETFISRVNNGKELILYNSDTYYFDGIKMYKKIDSYQEFKDIIFDFDIWRFNPLFITNLIDKGEFNAKTEYQDDTISNEYLVKVKDFVKLYDNLDIEDERTFSLVVYQTKKQVNKVTLDLTNIYNMKENANAFDYKVNLEYDLINEIAPITVNIESSDE